MADEKQVVSAATAVRRNSPAVTVGLGTVVSETLSATQAAEVKEVVETALESLVTAPAAEAVGPISAPATLDAPAAPEAPAKAVVADATVAAPVLSEAAQRLNAALAKVKKKYHFVKRFLPADVITFPDKTEFKFPLILRNTGGYSPGSEVKTDDEKLAANLREAAKNPHLGLVEIEVK